MEPDEISSEIADVIVPESAAGRRLDSFLADAFAEYSRTSFRKVIHAGGAQVDGNVVRGAFKLKPGHRVTIRLPEMPDAGPTPENIPLDVLYEDEHLAAINKPPNMVVHPAKGHWKGTLTAALAFHFQNLSDAGGPTRPGIVHRLDRETSGVLVVAKTNQAHFALAAQFEDRTTEKEYLAIVVGTPNRDRDIVDAPIGIHPYQREKMAIRANHSTSRDARTFYEVTRRFHGFAEVKVLPKTGRTHQIRVHLAHVGCPVLCDRQYGGRAELTRGELFQDLTDQELILTRHALHARRLKLVHPLTKQPIEFVAPLPADMERVLTELNASAKKRLS